MTRSANHESQAQSHLVVVPAYGEPRWVERQDAQRIPGGPVI